MESRHSSHNHAHNSTGSSRYVRWRLIVLAVAVYLLFAFLIKVSTTSDDEINDRESVNTPAPLAGASPLNARRRAAVISLARAAWNASNINRGEPAKPTVPAADDDSGGGDDSVAESGSGEEEEEDLQQEEEEEEDEKRQNGTASFKTGAVVAHDAIDTLILLGLESEASQALKWIKRAAAGQKQQQPQIPAGTKLSDAVQRYVGGLVGAYALTGNQFFMDRTYSLVTSIQRSAFPDNGGSREAPEVIPPRFINSNRQKQSNADQSLQEEGGEDEESDYEREQEELNGRCLVSEIFSLAVPFTHLATQFQSAKLKEQGTRFQKALIESGILSIGVRKAVFSSADYDPRFDLAGRPSPKESRPGLLPCFVACKTAAHRRQPLFSGSVSAGTRFGRYQLESYLKQWILSGKKEDDLASLYEDAVDALLTQLLRYAPKKRGSGGDDEEGTKLSFHAILGSVSLDFDASSIETEEMCRIPGILALGLIHGVHSSSDSSGQHNQHRPRDTPGARGSQRSWSAHEVEAIASDLLTTCVSILLETPTHMMPKVKHLHSSSNRNKHRNGQAAGASMKAGGLAESLFYMYRFTKDEGLRDIAAEILTGFVKYSPTGAPLKNVMRPAEGNDFESVMDQPGFFSTLKFLFLIFSDEHTLPLDRFLFDHGGHVMEI